MAPDPRVSAYVDRLVRAARRLPSPRRMELVAEIESHLSAAIRPGATDAEVDAVLDRLGDPEGLVAAEPAARPADGRGTQEWAAIILLLFGGFVFGVGWLAGLIFLWGSRAWTTREKWIGTLIVPGGLAASLWAFFVFAATVAQTCSSSGSGATHCTGGTGPVATVVLLGGLGLLAVAPIVVAIYLARRAARRRSSVEI